MKNADKRLYFLLFALFTFLFGQLLGLLPELAERLYSRGLFPLIRRAADATLGMSPVAWYYVFWMGIVVTIVRIVRQVRRSARPWRELFWSVAATASFLYALFQWSWGFNYSRVPFQMQAGLAVDSLTTAQLREELDSQTVVLTALPRTGTEPNPANLEGMMRPLVAAVLRDFGYPTAGFAPRCRALAPKGVLMRFSSAGVYWPFVSEANYDSGLHPLQKPYTVAHELAHAFGITDEGSCNFIAWLACRKSDDAWVRYSGELALWREIGGNYKYVEKEAYLQLRAGLPAEIVAHLDAINQNLQNYPDLVPLSGLYDWYLRWQGIPEGIVNYSKVIKLVRAYRLKNTHQ